ncbi:hypothetical protein COW36_01330 [bacterium (Candidatus Blackallbacteria) CG17_big_fil_post_rev_8_21_14_2_50_48_46]|uniref:protein O-GlcNAc transferase n=1 Tax=bacterium (Candidatus Blackallbacteria) CG17_big_fil_post_rev_8_21_14_2_50_48_46 TaxID=2014261 RepID=A0A2M7GBE1_9BACT|nr:MAG: hypothetical protein COW64_09845 [bacterium (Candidatus Blackallbacteria) CG18_big_fil_WC_8_21_14_2_50_49_26]PIW19509.1 MAG: hypothetical protein COW36_01330 [bacterium (Candidatus Blackallbacteria) CG17_big_fil_post_rev_8_21_14_2_50_48_46]PIW48887.1 MAG: hypothetical protein COW20_07125 [bacterium (Candidatus Blackallbacteria) CG13_big_fil_rev_8_21_14_2_50_49_14]
MSLASDSLHEIQALIAQSQWEEAHQACLAHLDAAPESIEGWYVLGLIAEQQGQLTEAEAAWKSALELQPEHAACHFQLGVLLQAQAQEAQALNHFQAARAFAPENFGYTRSLARSHLALGQREDLMIYVREILQQNDQEPEGYYLLGAAFQLYGRFEDAEAALRQALLLEPMHLEAAFQLGLLFCEQKRWGEAGQTLEVTLSLAIGQKTRPVWLARVWSLLGLTWQEQGQLGPAAEAWQAALKLWPEGRACTGLALQLPEIYLDHEALATWRAQFLVGLETLESTATEMDSPLQNSAQTPYALAYQGLADRELLERCGHFYQQFLPAAVSGADAKGPQTLIWSGISPLWQGALLALAQEISALKPLEILTPDPVQAEKLFQAGLSVQLIPPRRELFARALQNLEPAQIFYADLRDPLAYSLALERFAPTQAVFALQPETSGLNSLDLFFSAQALESDLAQADYSEKLVCLNQLPLFPLPTALPETWKTRRELRMAELGHVYLCPMHLAKVHPDFDAVLKEILARDRRAVIYFLHPAHSVTHTYLQQRFQETVGEKADKIRFLPCAGPEDLLQILHAADLVVDTPYCGGRASVAWALALGVPVVTWEGPQMRGRWAAAWNRHLGLAQFVVSDLQKLAPLASETASSGAWRAILKEALSQRFDTLWNPAGVAQALAI